MAALATELHLSLAADDRAPAGAREAIRALGVSEWALGDAMLVASELVTDAIRGASPDEESTLTLAAQIRERTLLISVTVERPASEAVDPEPQVVSDDIGLRVVEVLSQRCGIELGSARRAWAELALPASAGG